MVKITKIKVTCLCIKGRSGETMINFEKWLSMVKKPLESHIVDEESFYFIYDFKKDKDMTVFVNERIPKTVKRIRDTFSLIIKLVTRVNKISAGANWAVDKCLRWIRSRILKKMNNDQKGADDAMKMIKDINLEDRDEMVTFLARDLITWEVVE